MTTFCRRWIPALMLLVAGCSTEDPATQGCTRMPLSTSAGAGGSKSGGTASGDCGTKAARSAIAIENARTGTDAWALEQPATNHEVEGYASTTSAEAGDTVSVSVDVSEAHDVRWELYRVGYYGGSGARLVDAGAPVHVEPQGACPADPDTGLIECHWAAVFSIDVQSDWVTGQYLLELIRDDGFDSYVPFVVRESGRRAPLLVQSSVTTWQAYNPWGGADLYMNQLANFSGPRAHRVSFDRPYQGLTNADVGAGQLFATEVYMIRWLEMQGYDLSYVTDLDVDATGGLLDGRRLFVSMGHDEYWSVAQRDAVQHARDQGVSLAFFSANTAYWRVRVDPSSSGASGRILTCYKDATADPVRDARDTTVRFRDAPDAEPEDALIGQMYELFTHVDGFPLVVSDPKHWLYAGAAVARGDTLSHVIGNEWDHVWATKDEPASLEVPAHSDAFGAYGSDAPSDVTVYYPTSFSFVFSGGTIHWAWGLGKEGYSDPRIQKMTENVFARAGFRASSPTVVPPRVAESDVGSASRVTLVAGNGAPGDADGRFDAAQLDAPAGVAADPFGDVYVTDTRNHRIRRIDAVGNVSTVAGCGPSDVTTSSKFRDGVGTQACFSAPTGIAIGKDGTIYVSDSHNNRIRAMTAGGKVTTFAGNGTSGEVDATDPRKAELSYPRGLAVAPDGSLYVADAAGLAIRRVGPDGVTTVTTGPAEISAVAVAEDGTVYAVTANGISTVEAGHLVPIVNIPAVPGDQIGDGATARLRPADGLVVDGDYLVVSDSANYKVRRVERFGRHRVTTLAGDGRGGSGLGTGATAHLANPRGIARIPSGYLVADSGNHRVVLIQP
jgi:hypothetical protein